MAILKQMLGWGLGLIGLVWLTRNRNYDDVMDDDDDFDDD